jgi:predicted HicB family RNase H-like nuclease
MMSTIKGQRPRAKRRKTAGPLKSYHKTKVVRLPARMRDTLELMARRMNTTASDVARRALTAWIDDGMPAIDEKLTGREAKGCKQEYLSFCLSRRLHRILRDEAKSRGTSVSHVIRAVLYQHVARARISDQP